MESGRAPVTVVVHVRRFHCEGCGAVVFVTPSGVAPRKHFSGPAIAFALALFGLANIPALEVRRRASPWQVLGAAARGWRSLARWVGDIQRGALFPGLRPAPCGLTVRQRAAHFAAALSAHALSLSRGDLLADAFDGGARLA